LLIAVFAEPALAMVAAIGPAVCVHEYLEIEPSGSEDALPFRFTVLVGSVMVKLPPAFALGGLLLPGGVPLIRKSLSVFHLPPTLKLSK